MRKVQIALPVMLILAISSVCAQDVAYSRRLSAITATFLGSIQGKVDPTQRPAGKGSVLIVFRTSEQGAVIDARAIAGPLELQALALNAINQWKFKAMSVGGQPVQIDSAVIIDFSQNPPEIHLPKPMTAQQLSPSLDFKCLNGLLHRNPDSVGACQQQLATVEHSQSTPMDHFTAQDEYGLALMNYADDARRAVGHFSRAIQIASERLRPSDAEWAYVYCTGR